MKTPDRAEKWRPQYHYSPLDSRAGDPNGLVYYKGVYHLYHQQVFIHEPERSKAVGQHWGHATSKDLIHWETQQTALFPDDVGHMWSGTAVVDHNNSSGFFTDTPEKQGIVAAYSTNTQHVGIAYSKDGGQTFTKVSTTEPVIPNPGIRCFRDPHIFWHPETEKWKMVVAGHSGIIWIYEADDLVHWRLCSANRNITTECPNLIRMKVEGSDEEKWVLTCVGREYYVGTFDGCRFRPETDRIPLNEGPDAYAGITFSDMPDDRTVMINWLFALPDEAEGKWAGCYSTPVELKLVRTGGSYRILQAPVRELSLIKGENLLAAEDLQCSASQDPLEGINADCFDLYAEVELTGAENAALAICRGENEETVIAYEKASGCLSVRRCVQAHVPGRIGLSQYSFYIDPQSTCENTLKLRLLVDVSTAELFVNDGYYYFAMRIRPQPVSRRMSLRCDGESSLRSLSVDRCRSIWFENRQEPDPLSAGDKAAPICAAPAQCESAPACNVIDEIACVHPLYCWFNTTFENGGSDFFQKIRAGQAREIIVNADNFFFPVDVKLCGKGVAELLFRMTGLDDFYCVSLDARADAVILWKKVGGCVTQLDIFRQKLSVNRFYSLGIRAAGSALHISLDGKTVFDVRDASLTTGRIATNIYIADAAFRFGRFEDLF